MPNIIRGVKPDLTIAQIIGIVIAGVPIVAKLLSAFGVYDLTPEQEDALKEALTWAAVAAGALFVSDAHLRGKRNEAAAVRDAALLTTSTPAAPSSDQIVQAIRELVASGDIRVGSDEPAVPRTGSVAASRASAAETGTGTLSEFTVSGPVDSTPVERVATPVEDSEQGVTGEDAIVRDQPGGSLVSDQVEFDSPPPLVGRPADPDGAR